MSDKEESLEQVDVDEGLSKEERLEAARKKYEELKKKKKKTKKKNKKKTDDKTDDKETENDDKDEDGELKEEPVEAGESEAGESVEPESKEEKEQSAEPDSKEEKEELPESESNPLEKLEEKENPNGDITEQSGANTPQSLVTPTEVNELKSTIAQQEKTIKKLRDENTDLKLSKMDMNDKIHELEALINQLKSGATASSSPAMSQQPFKKIEPAKQFFTKNEYASKSQQEFGNSNTDDFREKLLLWKGWQVDMTYWNSTYTTEKVTL